MPFVTTETPLNILVNRRINVDTELNSEKIKVYILIVQDGYLNYQSFVNCQLYPSKSLITGSYVKKIFLLYFAGFGFPKRIHSDQDTEIINKSVNELAKLSGQIQYISS